MTDTRVALLVGCCTYADAREYPSLPPPAQDVEKLGPVLADSAIGGFTVLPHLLNEPSQTVRERIVTFFRDRRPDDLLLLYFSCHGDLDQEGQLYFIAADTTRSGMAANGISAQWVKARMDESGSQRIILLLDCCYSGAFPNGLTRGDVDDADRNEIFVRQLGGRGRVVITASRKLEGSYESVFTDAVVQGLATGAADLNGDGDISVFELFEYVSGEVLKKTVRQTPTISVDGVFGDLILAKNCGPKSSLPDEIQQALPSKSVVERSWAVVALRKLLAGDYPGGLKRAARQALLGLCRDANRDIRKAAGQALGVAPRNRQKRVLWIASGVAVALAIVGAIVVVPPLEGNDSAGPSSAAVPCVPSARTADGVLSLGTLLPKTGTFVYSGPAQEAAVQLAMNDINQAGGVPGISVVKLDPANQRDEGNPAGETAGEETDKLLAADVDVIIGPATSEVAGKVMDKVTCRGTIMFATANTSPEFTKRLDHGLYFRAAPVSTFEGSVLGGQVVKDGNSTVVLMSREGLYGDYLRKFTQQKIEESGGRVLDSFSYSPSALDYKKEIQTVKDRDPQAIVLIGFTESAPILRSMIEAGIGPGTKKVYLSAANMTNILAGQVSPRDPGVLGGVRGTQLDTGGEEFLKRLREVSPGLRHLTYSPQAYDAVVITVLAAAIAGAGTDRAADIAKEINGVTRAGERCTSFAACMELVKKGKDIDYDGPAGRLEFSEPGEPTEGTYVVGEIEADGTVKAVRSETVVFRE